MAGVQRIGKAHAAAGHERQDDQFQLLLRTGPLGTDHVRTRIDAAINGLRLN